MTNTEFNKMKRAVEKYGSFRISDSAPGCYTEVIKFGSGDYAVYACGPMFRDCFATEFNLDRLKHIFVD